MTPVVPGVLGPSFPVAPSNEERRAHRMETVSLGNCEVDLIDLFAFRGAGVSFLRKPNFERSVRSALKSRPRMSGYPWGLLVPEIRLNIDLYGIIRMDEIAIPSRLESASG